jgi:hypothetical protein
VESEIFIFEIDGVWSVEDGTMVCWVMLSVLGFICEERAGVR